LGVSDQEMFVSTSKKSVASTLRDWIVVIIVALAIATIIRVFILQQFYIAGPSMETTLFQDNRVLVSKFSYRFFDINRGDVVVFDRVTKDGGTVQHDDLIKRVIGLSGEKIEIKSCIVFINDQPLLEPYLDAFDLGQSTLEDRCRTPVMEPLVVPPGDVFVMGDNRPQSFDSRMFGPIDESLIVGRAFVVVWPLSMAKLL
jgi:signal peptidase I